MAEPTQATVQEDTPTPSGWCHWHQGHADGIRLINVIEQGSGPGATQSACPPCISAHGLTLFKDRR
ncbi:hypothetical protein [Streptomyces antibioticus]|uniref:hypothetical protein n=1 Tax=Streptomyces antibioticus TaxID=1890 RepID=UPI003F44962F